MRNPKEEKTNKKPIFVVIMPALLMTCGSSPAEYGDFNIYQVLDSGIPQEGPTQPIDSLALSVEPILSVNDIASYSWPTHDFTVTSSARSMFDSIVSNYLLFPFVACVGNERIYYGCFVSMKSSYTPSTYPYILVSVDLGVTRALNDTIIDRRNDNRIYNSLKAIRETHRIAHNKRLNPDSAS